MNNYFEIDITKSKLHIDKLKSFFKKKDTFTTKEIGDFYKKFEPFIKRTTINWRIYVLTQNRIITRIGRGKYTLAKKRIYVPEISHRAKLLTGKLKEQFPFSSACLWDTLILNEFTIHQANKYFLLIEVEKEVTQAVFYFLTEKGYKVFIEPTLDIIDKYTSNENNYLIVKTLISEAPTQKIKNVTTITLEKLLVDIFCDKTIFLPYQGNEMKRIFSSAFNKYLINENKLLRYANRRGKKEEIKNYIKQINGNK